MKMNDFEALFAALTVQGLGGKSLQSVIPIALGLPSIPDLMELDALIKGLANLNRRIKYTGIDSLKAGLDNARKIEEIHLRSGIMSVTWNSPLYPSSLLDLKSPPPILYLRGDHQLLQKSPKLALIGKRKADAYILRSLHQIAKRCALENMVIVSGLAFGCDAAAHRGCLEVGGKTIAVLPSEVKSAYPRQHQDLAEEIVESGGVLVSEYPVGTQTQNHMFLSRDRLIAALSNGLICGQADRQGGSINTCKYSIDLGRHLATVQLVDEGNFEGNQFLIESGMAAVLSDKSDLLNFLSKIRKSN
jgi:DNA processing protein